MPYLRQRLTFTTLLICHFLWRFDSLRSTFMSIVLIVLLFYCLLLGCVSCGSCLGLLGFIIRFYLNFRLFYMRFQSSRNTISCTRLRILISSSFQKLETQQSHLCRLSMSTVQYYTKLFITPPWS